MFDFLEILAPHDGAGGPPPYQQLPTLKVASDTTLTATPYRRRLAMATAALPISRRKLVDEIADVVYGFGGCIEWPNGTSYEPPDIDDAFGNDPSFRWLSDFLKFADHAPRQAPQERTLARLRLIDLYFRIEHPERAKWIAE